MFQLNFYQDQSNWKLIPIEVSKNISHRGVDLIIYKSHFVLIIKLNVFLGNHNCSYVCRKCLYSYTSQKMITDHKQQC